MTEITQSQISRPFRDMLHCVLSPFLACASAGGEPLASSPGERVAQATAEVGGSITLVDQMPNLPQPFRIIDWKQRARDFDRLAFDEQATGRFLPLVHLKETPPHRFALPSYVGSDGGGEGIANLAALVSATLVGVDKSNDRGRNWIQMSQDWFSPEARVVLNNAPSRGSKSFWYDVLPGVLFAQLANCYPQVDGMDETLRSMADRYREAVKALGGVNADFNWTGFDFVLNQPIFNGQWREPDAAAGVAFIEYAAWVRFKSPEHLETAKWCLDFLDRRQPHEGSPLYETLLFYAPALAARMNAVHGTHYDVAKLVNWCLAENQDKGAARGGWGVMARRFGDYDVHGLQGSTFADWGYPFAMNSFNAAGSLAPLVRYDARFARPLGKWLLHVANNSRLFYSDELPAELQLQPDLRDTPLKVVPYEGLRENGWVAVLPVASATQPGQSTADGNARPTQQRPLCLLPSNKGLVHRWEFEAPHKARSSSWHIGVRTKSSEGCFQVFVRPSPDKQWQPVKRFPSNGDKPDDLLRLEGNLGDVREGQRMAIKIETIQPTLAELRIEDVRCKVTLTTTPFASGDPIIHAWGAPTDLAIYGGAYCGYLAALVERTNCEHVLRFDLLRTDFFHGDAYPTWLYYNPDAEPRHVLIHAGIESHDLYDAVSRAFLAKGVKGEAEFVLNPDSAAIIVLVPSNAQLEQQNGITRIDGVLVGGR